MLAISTALCNHIEAVPSYAICHIGICDVWNTVDVAMAPPPCSIALRSLYRQFGGTFILRISYTSSSGKLHRHAVAAHGWLLMLHTTTKHALSLAPRLPTP